MADAMTTSHWCYMCRQRVNPVMEPELKCPFCDCGFVEEIAGRVAAESEDVGSERVISSWASVMMGMMGNPPRRPRSRRFPRIEDDDDDSDLERELESILWRRRRGTEEDGWRTRMDEGDDESDAEHELESILQRRRQSSAIHQLLRSLRDDFRSESDEPEMEHGRAKRISLAESRGERSRVVAMEPPNSESAVPSPSATDVPCSSLMAVQDEVAEMTLTVKWSGKEYTVRVCGDDSVAELKRRICEVTNVLPKRQKLLYPKLANKLGDDTLILSQFNLKPSVKMTMIGTVEDDIIIDQLDSPEIVDDFELGQDEVVDVKDKDVNKQKLQRRITQYKIKLLNPCREGKKLLVLDIDYTLFDHRSPAENPLELMRPYLHEFLSAVYSEYDIIIWSATSMKWVELKMGQLGVLNNSNYKITALLDHLAMITVQTDSHGTFDCKPLGLIWAQFPKFYSSTNTIMFDDLRRNFVMNPQNGLTIRPFRKAHLNRSTDQELAKLTQYLLAIAELPDLSSLNHKNWESCTEDSYKRRRNS